MFLALLFCLNPARVQAEEPGELAITDALGRQVRLTAPPRRIVTVFSSNTELVAALGLADRIVGIDALTYYPPEIAGKPKIGGRLGISLERVVEAGPDLVIMTPARQAVHNLLGPLEKLGIPAVVFTGRSVEEIMGNIEKTAIICGVPGAGETLIQNMKARFQQIKLSREGLQAPRVVFITGRLAGGLFLTVREGSYTADIVKLAGGILALDEVGAKGPRVSQISPEALMNADPDIIIYARRRGEGTEVGDYLKRPDFFSLAAVRGKQVYDVPSAEFLIPSPTVVKGVERLADIFGQWDRR